MARKSKKRSAEADPDEAQRSSSRVKGEEDGEEEEEIVEQGENEEEDQPEEEDEGEPISTQVKEEDDQQEEEQDADVQQEEGVSQEEQQKEDNEENQEELAEEDKEENQEEEMAEENREDNDVDNEEMEDQEEIEGEDNDANDNDEDDEEEPTEEVKKKIRKINPEGRPAEAGVIKTVLVENFMCHQKLKVDLCRNVNFIHGQNGSGKSAILAAIQICLGANARRTHRARNIKDLVRKEATGTSQNNCAKVRVTLLNGGGEGYKPELYGDKITVERTINLRSGFNGYKLFDADDKEVSRKKCDLDDMLDYLNIQVDNPVAILDQEDAKKFLAGKASDKHDFFMKATELQRIDKVFAAIEDRSIELEGQRSRISDQLEREQEKVKLAKKKVDEFQKVEELEKKRLAMEADYAWAFYAERNGEYEEAVKQMEAFQEKAKSKQEELTQAEEQASGANDQNEEQRIKDKMVELENEAKIQAQLKRDLEARVKLAQNPVKQAQRQMKNLEAEKKTASQQISRANRRLKEAREEMLSKAGSAESEEARRTALLNETEEALARAKAETEKLNEVTSLAYRDYEELEPAEEQAKQTASQRGKQCYVVKNKLKELSSSETNDPAAIFGRKCSEMVKLVENARRKRAFRGEVIGPIGGFLKIAPGKEKYAELAELAIGNNNLDRFIVTNDQDRKVLDKLRQQAQCFRECGIFQIKPHPRYNVPPPPAPEIETVASVLVVSNDIVFNCLVDNAMIDQRALGPSKEITEHHLLISENGRDKIKGGLKEVLFLPRGDKWLVRSGAMAIVSNTKKTRKMIGVDRTEAIKETEAELRQLEVELKESKAAEAKVAKDRHELQKKWNRHNKARRTNTDEIHKLIRKKEEIENEMETTANTTIDTTEMEEDVASAEEALEKVSEEKAKLKKELEGLQPDVDEAKNELEEVRTRNEKVIQDMKDAEESLDACIQRQSQSEVELQKKRARVQKYNGVIQKHQEKVDEHTTEREDALDAARKLAFRLQQQEKREEGEDGADSSSQTMTQEPTEEELEQVKIKVVEKEPEAYMAKLKRIKDRIVKERERRDLSNEDPLVATETYLKAKKNLQSTQDHYQQSESLYKQTIKDLRERRKRWRKLRSHLQKMTDMRFDEILYLNQASGNLEFDDIAGELNLVVQKDRNDPDSQTKDVKALSGGERSYTTISLLLALGESLETPFRVLDEFDVFMDPERRKLTIQTLIHVAKQMEHRQFIFITPQDVSSVKRDDKVKVFKLKPPARRENERAGGPTQTLIDSFSQSQG